MKLLFSLRYGVRRQSGAATVLWLLLTRTLTRRRSGPSLSRPSLVLGPRAFNLGLLLALCYFIVTLTGCKTFKPVEDLTRYYVLSPSAPSLTPADTNHAISIGISPVELPDYLQTSHIVVRRGPNQIHYSEYGDWAEHLDKGVQRVLAADIATLAPGTKTITSAWRSRDVIAEIHVFIRRFDLDDTGQATLACEWQIISANGQVIHTDDTFVTKKGPALATNPAAAVNTLSEALADLSKKIAAALQSSDR